MPQVTVDAVRGRLGEFASALRQHGDGGPLVTQNGWFHYVGYLNSTYT